MANKHLRSVNRILGEKPRLGPFPAEMIFPWSAIAILNVFIFYYTLKAGWLATFLSIAWGWATWWVVSEKKDFFGKFVGVPRITRGYPRGLGIGDWGLLTGKDVSGIPSQPLPTKSRIQK